jgi:DnaD/phage-associated family protein
MVNPQPTDAHLRMAHSIEEEIMMRDFTKRQRSVMDFIIRLSWGCGKKYAVIPMQKDFELVGLDQTKAKAEIDWLINARVISRDVTGKVYSFNKNFDEWKVSIVPNYNKDRFKELLSLNITTCQNSNPIDEKASSDYGTLDEKASEDLTKKQVEQGSNKPNEAVTDVSKESIKEIIIEEVINVRAREGEIFKFYNQNIGLITRFQSEVIGQYLDEGMQPDMILAVLQDSIGKGNSWDWIKTVLENSAKANIKTVDQYEAGKIERANAKSRDKPPDRSYSGRPPQAGNFEQRKHPPGYFDKLYKEV